MDDQENIKTHPIVYDTIILFVLALIFKLKGLFNVSWLTVFMPILIFIFFYVWFSLIGIDITKTFKKTKK